MLYIYDTYIYVHTYIISYLIRYQISIWPFQTFLVLVAPPPTPSSSLSSHLSPCLNLHPHHSSLSPSCHLCSTLTSSQDLSFPSPSMVPLQFSEFYRYSKIKHAQTACYNRNTCSPMFISALFTNSWNMKEWLVIHQLTTR